MAKNHPSSAFVKGMTPRSNSMSKRVLGALSAGSGDRTEEDTRVPDAQDAGSPSSCPPRPNVSPSAATKIVITMRQGPEHRSSCDVKDWSPGPSHALSRKGLPPPVIHQHQKSHVSTPQKRMAAFPSHLAAPFGSPRVLLMVGPCA
jgi:hypothetical protein